jgi:hypothetical protein
MANPHAPYPDMTPNQGVVTVSVSFPVGATGAVGTVTGGREMGTPVRNGVGDYSFPLREGWVALDGAECIAVGAHSTTSGKNAIPIANSVASTSAPLVRFQFCQLGTGAAAEVAETDVVICTLRLRAMPLDA